LSNIENEEIESESISYFPEDDEEEEIVESEDRPFSSKCTGNYSKAETQSAQDFYVSTYLLNR
jgi:hypothetical protein